MKVAILNSILIAASIPTTPVFARELVCNSGALVIRENDIRKQERQYPDPDLIATVYEAGVAAYLEQEFTFGGDGGYGRLAYQFDGKRRSLKMHFHGENTLDDQKLITAGKFSNGYMIKEGRGVRVQLVGGSKSAEWFFESCEMLA